VTPFLFVPYFLGDDGSRPIPANVPAWMCPSILVNGQAYAWAPIKVGQPVDLSIIVGNRGAMGTAVTVRVFWTDPSSTFTPANLQLIFQTAFFLPGFSRQASPTFSWIPPNSMPEHACLLVEVTSGFDTASGSFSPGNDRHYAQQNLSILGVQPGERRTFHFFANSSSAGTNTYRLNVRPMKREALTLLAGLFRAEIKPLERRRIILQVVYDGADDANRDAESFSYGRHIYRVIIEVPNKVESGDLLGVEIEQEFERTGKHPPLIGNLALVLSVQNSADQLAQTPND
jgi:hypothetical protein